MRRFPGWIIVDERAAALQTASEWSRPDISGPEELGRTTAGWERPASEGPRRGGPDAATT